MAAMKIVVGVDDSAAGEAALRTAIRYAEKLGAEVDAVFVSHVPATVLAAMGGVPSVGEEFAAAQRAQVWRRMRPIIDAAPVTVHGIDIEGYPPDALVAHADSVDAGLVVVGTRGRGEIASLLLGSTSHRVVNHAPCDVLVVRQHEEAT
ncbi:MAG: universal stress protein [Acidimicrobiia bacterium]|nr:universal stress protein [Acidimicrobiia bacterium]